MQWGQREHPHEHQLLWVRRMVHWQAWLEAALVCYAPACKGHASKVLIVARLRLQQTTKFVSVLKRPLGVRYVHFTVEI